MDRRTFLQWLSLCGGFPNVCAANTTDYLFAENATLNPEKMLIPNIDDEGWPKISLIACGAAGIAMARHVNKSAYGLHEIIAIDTSQRTLKSVKNADRTLLIETSDGQKPQSAYDAWNCSDEHGEAISQAIGNPLMAIIFTGLGGSGGTGIASMVSAQARSAGVFTVALATKPFAFEDPLRQKTSEFGFIALASFCCTCVLPLQVVADHLGPESDFNGAFRYVGQAVHHFLWNTAGCISRRGLIGIDLEDVRTVLAPSGWGGNLSSSIGWGEGAGENRAMLAVQQAVNHPLQWVGDKDRADRISVSVRAQKKTLKMKEINTVMQIVKEVACHDDSYLIFSGDYDATLGDRMEVSIVMVREREGLISS